MGTERVFRVAGAQIDNRVGDLHGNAESIREAMVWAEGEGADAIVFPELALTGYPVGDLVLRDAFVDEAGRVLAELARSAGATAAIVGTVGRVPPRRSWDTRERSVAISAAVLCDGEVRGIYHKVLLPNYELFDEARNFAPGTRPDMLWRIGPHVAGISICEDMWSGDGPPEAQAAAGAEILLVPNASPFHLEKPAGRHELASQVARRNGTPVVYVNFSGGHDELVFDGGSLVVDSRGEPVYRGPQFETARFCVDVSLGERRPLLAAPTTVHSRPTELRPPLPPPQPAPELSPVEQAWRALVTGTRDFAIKNGADAVTVGLSGGIDAAVTATVAADALGPDRVLGVAMPAPDTPDEELEDAHALAEALGIEFAVVPVGGMEARLHEDLDPVLEGVPDPAAAYALTARLRAAVLWSVSDQRGYLVLATGNKTELSVGSAVIGGDLSGAFAPLKDCTKTLLYRMARWRNERDHVIPARILDRPPSVASGEENQLPAYEVLDDIVERYVERGEDLDELVADGFDEETVRGVLQLVDDADFKRRQTPPGVKISKRTFGQDLRMPITNFWRPFRREEAELVAIDEDAPHAVRTVAAGI